MPLVVPCTDLYIYSFSHLLILLIFQEGLYALYSVREMKLTVKFGPVRETDENRSLRY